MKSLIILLLLALSPTTYAKQLRVAIIDSGLDQNDPRFKKLLCKDGKHWNFVSNISDTTDYHGHGTHIAGIIKQHAGNADYCLIIYKFWTSNISPSKSIELSTQAMKRAMIDKVDIINYSAGGIEYSLAEKKVLEELSKRRIKLVVAAGNESANLDVSAYYPASHNLPGMIAVGNLIKNNNGVCLRNPSSNSGTIVKNWEIGTAVKSTYPNSNWAVLSGTSQATAVRTGKIISGKPAEKCKSIF